MHQPPISHVAATDPQIAELIDSDAPVQQAAHDEAIMAATKDDEAAIESVAGNVRELLAGFPMPGYAQEP